MVSQRQLGRVPATSGNACCSSQTLSGVSSTRSKIRVVRTIAMTTRSSSPNPVLGNTVLWDRVQAITPSHQTPNPVLQNPNPVLGDHRTLSHRNRNPVLWDRRTILTLRLNTH